MSTKNEDQAQNSQSATNEAIADNADGFRGAANRNGTFEDLKNLGFDIIPGVNIIKPAIMGDTDKQRNTTILKDNQMAEKATLLQDAKKAGMSDKDAANMIKDIDKRTSIDAFDKQKLGQNQGGKYQKDYDRHVLDVFGDHKMQQVRADALTLYNRERNDKDKLHNGNGLMKDKTARSAADQTDHQVNQMLGVNNPAFGSTSNPSFGKVNAPTSKHMVKNADGKKVHDISLGSGNASYSAQTSAERATQNQAGIGNAPSSGATTTTTANTQQPHVTQPVQNNQQAQPKMNANSVSNTNTKTDFSLEQQLGQANQKNAILEQLLNGVAQGTGSAASTDSQAAGPTL